MQELFYLLKTKITYRLSELVIDGNHIKVHGNVYERLSSRPHGRRVAMRLRGENERLILYK